MPLGFLVGIFYSELNFVLYLSLALGVIKSELIEVGNILERAARRRDLEIHENKKKWVVVRNYNDQADKDLLIKCFID